MKLPRVVRGDSKCLVQVAVNIVQNAIQNSRDNGKVKVQVAYDK